MSQYKRSNSQYGMRGHIHEERSSAAASRQRSPRVAAPVPQHIAEVADAQRLYFAAREAFKRGECADPQMRDYVIFVDGGMAATEYAKELLAEMVVTA